MVSFGRPGNRVRKSNWSMQGPSGYSCTENTWIESLCCARCSSNSGHTVSTTDTDACSPGESSGHVSGGRGGDGHGETDHR